MANEIPPDHIAVEPPTLPPFHLDRIRECQDSLAGAMTAVMDNAEAAGWTIAESTIAISALADEVMLYEVDIEETNFLLREILKR